MVMSVSAAAAAIVVMMMVVPAAAVMVVMMPTSTVVVGIVEVISAVGKHHANFVHNQKLVFKILAGINGLLNFCHELFRCKCAWQAANESLHNRFSDFDGKSFEICF